MENITKKILAAAVTGLVLGAAGGAMAGVNVCDDSEMIALKNEQISELQRQVNVSAETITELEGAVPEIVEVVKKVEVEKLVEVDNGNLNAVLEYVHDQGGRVEDVTEDLDDDEIDQIVDRVMFMNEAVVMSRAYVKSEIVREVDRMVVDGEELDKNDIDRLKVEDEVEVSDVDFDYEDAEVTFSGTFEQDEVKYEFEAVVEVKDGGVDGIKDISVEEE